MVSDPLFLRSGHGQVEIFYYTQGGDILDSILEDYAFQVNTGKYILYLSIFLKKGCKTLPGVA